MDVPRLVAACFAQTPDPVDPAHRRHGPGRSSARSGPPPQVVRAMENLAASVRLRLQGQPAGEAQIHAITAV